MAEVEQLIARYQLTPHPEGGWYREVHRSTLPVKRGDGATRSGLTLILFLLAAPALSRWHRVQQADESWHVVAGDPLELWTLPPEGGKPRCTRLGFSLNDATLQPLAVVPANWWQAARCLGRWSLVSCSVGPGFEFDDFCLLAELPAEQHPSGALAALL